MARVRIGRPSARTVTIMTAPLLVFVLGTAYLVGLTAGLSTTTDPPPAASSATPSEQSTPDGQPTAPTDATPSTAKTTTRQVVPSRTTKRPPPPRPPIESINVGGVQLDGGNRDQHCKTFTHNSQFSIPVRVTDIRIVNGPPFMTVDHNRCRGLEYAPCLNATLPPGGTRCVIAAGVKPGGPTLTDGFGASHTGKVELTLRATCTSKAGTPCSLITRHTPTPANPVEVTWEDRDVNNHGDRLITITVVEDAPATPDTGSPPSSEGP
ncbi:hypothetical protein OG792_25115 [Micromonospora sp. NBC_01699]|uniref:hypothetical protein n=1 Tax=Micromonospora sp. NBC_01699 TaxID=2975984 RepID=UPI002E2BDA67|nr:hypothetical protein [Micromonospora sp. NBC_01699]